MHYAATFGGAVNWRKYTVVCQLILQVIENVWLVDLIQLYDNTVYNYSLVHSNATSAYRILILGHCLQYLSNLN